MKKALLMILLSTTIFAGGSNEVLEGRVETKLQMKNVVEIKNYEVDYNIDVYGNQMNIEIEIEGMKEPKLSYTEIAKDILNIVKSDAKEIKDVQIIIKFDPVIGEEQILYSEGYSL